MVKASAAETRPGTLFSRPPRLEVVVSRWQGVVADFRNMTGREQVSHLVQVGRDDFDLDENLIFGKEPAHAAKRGEFGAFNIHLDRDAAASPWQHIVERDRSDRN